MIDTSIYSSVVIPDYYRDELNRVKKAAIADQKSALFSALVIADLHIDYKLTLNKSNGGHFWHAGNTGELYRERDLICRQLAATVELANTTNVDCVICGGDILHGTSSHEDALSYLSFVSEILGKCKKPVYVCRGNHDLNDYHGVPCPNEYIVTREEWNSLLLNPLSQGAEIHCRKNTESTYFYVDFEDKRLRLITLDSYTYPLTSADGKFCDHTAEEWKRIDDEQLSWFAEKALDAKKKGWTFMIASHAPICGDLSFSNSDAVRRIVSAFHNRERFMLGSKEIDYTDAEGTIPLSLSGHTHIASYRLFDEAQHICINTSAARLAYYPGTAEIKTESYVSEMPVRYEGTIAEAMLDIVTLRHDGSVIRRNFGPVSDAAFTPTNAGYRRISKID